MRSRKIRIYPKSQSLQTLKKYLGLSRHWYNKAVEYLKQSGTKAYLPEVRKIQKGILESWELDCPQRIREHSMADACKAVKLAKQKCVATGKVQAVKFRSRKDVAQRFGFDSIALKELFVFSKKYRVHFYRKEKDNAKLEGTKITLENGRWFLIIPRNVSVKQPENQRLGTVALDPGVRTFITFYSPFCFGKFGQGDFNRIARLCWWADKLVSKISKAKGRSKYRMKKALKRLKWKIKDLVSDIHHKVAYFLVTNFDTVLLPTFKVSQMTLKANRKLRSKTVRAMLNWSHYQFKMFLKAKAEEYNCQVIDVSEAYTSKTCSYCGRVHQIGGAKAMKCCANHPIDRDHNGGRGIFLRSLSATTVIES